MIGEGDWRNAQNGFSASRLESHSQYCRSPGQSVAPYRLYMRRMPSGTSVDSNLFSSRVGNSGDVRLRNFAFLVR